MSIIASLLAVAMFGHPQRACIAPTQTGTFRFTAVDSSARDASRTQIGVIMLENVDGCLEASVLTDAGAPSVIDALQVDGDSISGSVHTTSGRRATISLRLDAMHVAGSIADGRHVWALSGKRTSAAVPRVNGL
jgi:hypothetical protein